MHDPIIGTDMSLSHLLLEKPSIQRPPIYEVLLFFSSKIMPEEFKRNLAQVNCSTMIKISNVSKNC